MKIHLIKKKGRIKEQYLFEETRTLFKVNLDGSFNSQERPPA